MESNTDELFQKMCNKDEGEAYLFADKLAKIGTQEILERLVEVLKSGDMENAYLATRALSKMTNKQEALEPILEVIHDKKNQQHNGGLVELLENFDLSEKFVDLFRIYLFGNFKASAFAKDYLDSIEFEISPRILKKAEKHLNHFKNNINLTLDENKVKLTDAEEIINEIKEILSS